MKVPSIIATAVIVASVVTVTATAADNDSLTTNNNNDVKIFEPLYPEENNNVNEEDSERELELFDARAARMGRMSRMGRMARMGEGHEKEAQHGLFDHTARAGEAAYGYDQAAYGYDETTVSMRAGRMEARMEARMAREGSGEEINPYDVPLPPT